MSEIIKKVIAGEKAISSSALKEAKKSFRDFQHYYNKPKDKALHFDFGNAMELYLIDKPSFHKQVVVMDESKRPVPDKDYKTAANRDWKAIFLAQHEDKYIIPSTGKDSMESILKLESLCSKHPAIDMIYASDMNYQDAFEWVCPRTGFKRYARTDLYSPNMGIIVDIKTYDDEDFEKAATKFDYVLQAVDQIIGATLSGKMPEVKEYYWLAISKREPYFVDFYSFSLEENLRAEESYWSALLRLADTLKGDWENIVYKDVDIHKFKLSNWYK